MGNTWGILRGIFMEYLEGYCGIPREYSGNTLGNTWGILRGIFKEYLEGYCRIPREYSRLWVILGEYMGNTWGILGEYLGNT